MIEQFSDGRSIWQVENLAREFDARINEHTGRPQLVRLRIASEIAACTSALLTARTLNRDLVP